MVESSPGGQRVKGGLLPLAAGHHTQREQATKNPPSSACLPSGNGGRTDRGRKYGQLQAAGKLGGIPGYGRTFAAGGVRIIPIVLAITRDLVPLAAAF